MQAEKDYLMQIVFPRIDDEHDAMDKFQLFGML